MKNVMSNEAAFHLSEYISCLVMVPTATLVKDISSFSLTLRPLTASYVTGLKSKNQTANRELSYQKHAKEVQSLQFIFQIRCSL
jgi:hypothetical protein